MVPDNSGLPLIENILEQWKVDANYDKSSIDDKAIDTTVLHGEYLEYKHLYERWLIKLEHEYNVAKLDAELFYSGQDTPSHYQGSKFPRKLLKGDVPKWVEIDPRVVEIAERLRYCKNGIETIKEIIKQINNLGYLLKTCLESQRFYHGLN